MGVGEDQRLESGSPEDLILDDIDDKEIDAVSLLSPMTG